MNMQSTPDGTVAHGAAHSPLPQPLALQRNPAGTPPLTAGQTSTGQQAGGTGTSTLTKTGSGNYTEYRPGRVPSKRPLRDVQDVREVLQQAGIG